MGRRGPPPIDRGWAWVITAGMCLKSFIEGGFIKSYGMFFSAFLETYGGSASETQLVRSTRSIMATMSGPFGTALSERFTERVVVMAGAALISLAFILSSFAHSLQVLIVTFGVFYGIGLSLMNGPCKVCLGRYFDKKRGRAYSLSLVGAALGQIAVPPLISLLMDNYALRGTMLLYGGIFLNVIITGALLRPIESYRGKDASSSTNIHRDDVRSPKGVEFSSDILVENSSGELGKTTLQSDLLLVKTPVTNGDMNINHNVTDTSPVGEYSTTIPLTLCEKQAAIASLPVPNTAGSSSIISDRFHGSAKSLPVSEVIKSVGSRINVSTLEEFEPLESQLGLSKNNSRKCELCSPLLSFLKDIFSKELLTNPIYILYLITYGILIIATSNQITFIVPRAEEYGISREMTAVLLSIIGGCDIFGRLLTGVLVDVKRLKPYQVMAIGALLTGVTMLTLPFCKKFTEMVAVAVVYGIFGSSQEISAFPVLVSFVGTGSPLAKAIGLAFFFQGIMSAVFAPILGLVKDRSGSYDNIFYVTGSMQILASALLLFLEPLARRHQNAKFPLKPEQLDIKT